jgi:hypothetical protein
MVQYNPYLTWPCRESSRNSSAVQPVARRYTDRDIPAPNTEINKEGKRTKGKKEGRQKWRTKKCGVERLLVRKFVRKCNTDRKTAAFRTVRDTGILTRPLTFNWRLERSVGATWNYYCRKVTPTPWSLSTDCNTDLCRIPIANLKKGSGGPSLTQFTSFPAFTNIPPIL